MASRYKIIWTKSAKKDYTEILDSIWRYTYWPISVEKWAKIILRKVKGLEVFPELGMIYPLDKSVRFVIAGKGHTKYKILYEVIRSNHQVNILRIINSKRDSRKVRLKR